MAWRIPLGEGGQRYDRNPGSLDSRGGESLVVKRRSPMP